MPAFPNVQLNYDSWWKKSVVNLISNNNNIIRKLVLLLYYVWAQTVVTTTSYYLYLHVEDASYSTLYSHACNNSTTVGSGKLNNKI
jgi:hypothetical protein